MALSFLPQHFFVGIDAVIVRYPQRSNRRIAAAVASLGADQAYLDGELSGVRPDGITSFSMIQAASDSGNAAALVFFLFDLLHLDGEDVSAHPLIERSAPLTALLSNVGPPLHYSDHQTGNGRAFFERACGLSLEGIVDRQSPADAILGWTFKGPCALRTLTRGLQRTRSLRV